MDLVKGTYDFVARYTPLVFWLFSVLAFAFRQKIVAYFQKSLIATQEAYKRELENYKATLMRELEEYKLDIDIRRASAIQMADRKLVAYQKTLSLLTNSLGRFRDYNLQPSREQMAKVFRGEEGDVFTEKILDILYENELFFSEPVRKLMNKLPISKAAECVADIRPIDETILAKMRSGIDQLRKTMLSEILGEIA